MKKGFSLIEIVFVLMIIAVIITTAVSKFDTAFNNTYLTKIKADILQIRAGIQKYKNKMILANSNQTLTTLDDNSLNLFNLVLENPIIASNEAKATSWSKASATSYNVFIDNSTQLLFTYDASNHTFDCDISNSICKELDI